MDEGRATDLRPPHHAPDRLKDIFVVINPHSGKGRGARFVTPVLDGLHGAGDVAHALTTRAGEEAELAAKAVADGYGTIVAVGGDGTWSNVGNAILRSGKRARLGLVPGGTGCDLAKSLGIPQRDVQGCAKIIRDGHVKSIDVGRIEERYFLNIAGFGYDVAVLEDSWSVAYLEGSLLYLYCAVRQLGSFPGFPMEWGRDGESPQKRELLMLVFANARVFGGGFQIAPQADLADGALDAVVFGNMGFWARVGIMQKLRAGTHLGSPHVETSRGRRFVLRFAAPPAYETDGEWNRASASELRVEAVPQALDVLVPAEA
ncbi:MAG TPA: diacylglycerol kinase family protein [Vicinamibacteria bacterium]|nr:diacylglycerol kinase family protein [Vicinamibacteria bacterium]